MTWPKTRLLHSYVAELRRAERAGQVVNFRVGRPPSGVVDGRCYMVHDGAVRGWLRIIDVLRRGAGEVQDPITGSYWPPGFYIVREPIWFPIEPVPQRGFQGWRYFHIGRLINAT